MPHLTYGQKQAIVLSDMLFTFISRVGFGMPDKAQLLAELTELQKAAIRTNDKALARFLDEAFDFVRASID